MAGVARGRESEVDLDCADFFTDPAAWSRREFLGRLGLVTGGVLVSWQFAASAGVPAAADEQRDTDRCAGVASLEYATAAALESIVGRGMIQDRAVADAVAAFAAEHRQHGDGFAAASGGTLRPGTANKTLGGLLDKAIAGAADAAALTKIVFDLENAMAATHSSSLSVLTGQDTRLLAASTLPVEAAHAAALGYRMGFRTDSSEWLPKTQSSTGALEPAKYPIQ
jgi:hypothetical protein